MRTPSAVPTRSKTIGIRLTPTEREQVTVLARADDRSVGAYIRRLIQQHIGTAQPLPVPEAMQARGMRVEYQYPMKQNTAGGK